MYTVYAKDPAVRCMVAPPPALLSTRSKVFPLVPFCVNVMVGLAAEKAHVPLSGSK
jgi:hypothetical protein